MSERLAATQGLSSMESVSQSVCSNFGGAPPIMAEVFRFPRSFRGNVRMIPRLVHHHLI
jgi:hypothetical protein